MLVLGLGLLLFLLTHGVRIYGEDLRSALIDRLGEKGWKGAYSLLSLASLALIIWGFGMARATPVVVWLPPVWTRHLAALLVLLAFILVTASNLPGTRIKARVGHPMVAGVKAWSLAHLLANGLLVDMVLFGTFFAWSIANFIASRRRDRREGVSYPQGTLLADLAAVVIGLIAWALFARFAHQWLFGVSPLGGMAAAG
jgi:uncharacterized membrane protein